MAQSNAPISAEILALHNLERQRVGVPPIGWDPALEAAAIAYARALAASGRFAHSPREARIGQGENLWRGTTGAYNIAEMVGSWTGERRLFRAGIFPDVSGNGQWADVGHYSQMIWRGSTQLGCGLASARGEDVLVCRYAPAGNVVGRAVP
ncbi:MAG: CAP domain-containing protein [Sphingomicrobium sp.]